jgi:hypothetical protein
MMRLGLAAGLAAAVLPVVAVVAAAAAAAMESFWAAWRQFTKFRCARDRVRDREQMRPAREPLHRLHYARWFPRGLSSAGWTAVRSRGAS